MVLKNGNVNRRSPSQKWFGGEGGDGKSGEPTNLITPSKPKRKQQQQQEMIFYGGRGHNNGRVASPEAAAGGHPLAGGGHVAIINKGDDPGSALLKMLLMTKTKSPPPNVANNRASPPNKGSAYAGAKFSTPPSPTALPKPPSRWMSQLKDGMPSSSPPSAAASPSTLPVSPFMNKCCSEISDHLKILLNVQA